MAAKNLKNYPNLFKITYPHFKQSGRCYTHDPQMKSFASSYHGLRIGIKLKRINPEMTDFQKKEILSSFRIFLHEPGKFMYHSWVPLSYDFFSFSFTENVVFPTGLLQDQTTKC